MIKCSLKDSRFVEKILETIISTKTKVSFNKKQLKIYRMYLLIASNWKKELWKYWTGNQGTSAPVPLLCCVVLGKPLKWLAFGFLWVSWWLRWQRICLQCRSPGFNSWVGKIPWRREWFSLQYSYLENPMTEEPGGLHSSWDGRVGHDWVTTTFDFLYVMEG